MGQYYVTILTRNDKTRIYSPVVNGDWQGLKLTEHSWFENDYMSVIAKKILKKPTRVIWCGDYAEDEELQKFLPEYKVSEVQRKNTGVTSKSINNKILKNKYLVNHDKQIYIDLNRYYSIADEFNSEVDKGWIINPISILTALGNNRGGGDYYDGDRTTCFDKVGTWAYDLISLETEIPKDFKEEKHIIFTEHLTDENRRLADVYGLNTVVPVACK